MLKNGGQTISLARLFPNILNQFSSNLFKSVTGETSNSANSNLLTGLQRHTLDNIDVI